MEKKMNYNYNKNNNKFDIFDKSTMELLKNVKGPLEKDFEKQKKTFINISICAYKCVEGSINSVGIHFPRKNKFT